VHVDWTSDLNDPVRRDYISREGFEALMPRIGVTPEMTVVFYGDKSNWWACYAFWVFKLFGHRDARVMDGGRLKWEREGRPLTREVARYERTVYSAPERDDSVNRAFRQQVAGAYGSRRKARGRAEPGGVRGDPPAHARLPQRRRIARRTYPGAKNVPWARAVDQEDGTFKSADALRKIYIEEQGVNPDDEVVTYCRIGERSSHTWFALKFLLGFEGVRNYDGSWTEWGNLVGAPVEKGAR
jgi:thiosulfate/3-mercaptopyruvate sulfurtransferase